MAKINNDDALTNVLNERPVGELGRGDASLRVNP